MKLLVQVVDPILGDLLLNRVGINISLVKNWKNIVGADLAQDSYPVQMIWPKFKQKSQEVPLATLVIACNSFSAIYLQYMKKQLMDRINVFLGYTAIGKIQFKKTGGRKKTKLSKASPLSSLERSELTKKTSHISDPKLRELVYELGKNILKKNKSQNL